MYPVAVFALFALGLAFVTIFALYEVRTPSSAKSLVNEVGLSALSSVFLGLGTLILMLWAGLPI
ncbi:hypothetical protein SARC_08160 [Sphaeroforma arctica JP610]|uniref:Dolichyl-diphosphooligosaccharide-protein glycosyltransferase subunit OST5 n=1 Tax=Sphaeroforma arctica JP610 TaxID=667725 RepID=A0A0L0FRQ4_9EUKA|nr:hypothetical protein SARC_08160 [Sphaeroforma arctica JP610]KNC79450.1 hypothetical protein SARC_08160 [Sphaeroforma arctica JP610]|eukprot:XP_014153352.1 hypothetical protein SARC_08160 [Sphaeroforma arctica JP610]